MMKSAALPLLLLVVLARVSCQDIDETDAEDESTERSMDEGPVIFLPAASRAVEWVISQRNDNWGWGCDSANTVLALRLANATWFANGNLEAQLAIKQMELELVLKMWKHREEPITTGHLAVNVMTLVALCKDPRAFFSKDLVAMVEHQAGVLDFEIAFAQLATCTAGHHVRKSRIRRLLDITTDPKKIHSVDTLSVVILALHCAQHQRKHDLKHFIDQAMRTLLRQQNSDGSFKNNLHSTTLALQAMMSSKLAGSWNATRAQEYVMSHQLPDGSFGTLFDTNAVLPLLGGRTLLDIALRKCPKVEEDTVDEEDAPVDAFSLPSEPPPVPTDISPRPDITNVTNTMINVTYIIWKGNNASIHFNISLTVPENTNFYTVMKFAAEKDERFEFSASHWGNGFYVHTLSGAKEQKLGYWFWLLYRLKEPPVPGTKPSNDMVSPTGVMETTVHDGDIFLFWYHQI
ncbi:uncharacterized protein CG3556-like [Macrobrachium nipponense]|uniref:uncharacterized protein CG3556-like n=1 Tax=Macrobrachium nipponense TaxID=159736 RepID=UPI0030C8A270